MTDPNPTPLNETPATAADQADPPRPRISRQVIEQAQAAYTQAAPDIRRLAHHFHRRLHGEPHEEAVAETEAFAWKAFRKLAAEGRDPLPLVGNIVDYAARRVRAGHRFAGKVRIRDALSPVAKQRQGYFVTSLSRPDNAVAGEVRSALRHRVPSPAEEAITNADWQAFLESLPDDKYRGLAQGLAEGGNPSEIGAQRGVSREASRQIAGRLRNKYAAFLGTDKER